MKPAALFLAVCFLFAGAAPLLLGDAVDLVALKKQEEERRKKLGKSKAKITNDNVNTVAVGGGRYGYVQMEPEESADEDAGPGQAGAPKQDDVTKQPDFWKKQQVDLEQRISTLKADIERGQSDLNRLWSDFYIKERGRRARGHPCPDRPTDQPDRAEKALSQPVRNPARGAARKGAQGRRPARLAALTLLARPSPPAWGPVGAARAAIAKPGFR